MAWPSYVALLINKDSGFTRQEKKGLGDRTPEEKWVGLEVLNVLPAFFSWLEQIKWLCLTLRVQRNAMLCVPQSRSFQILLNKSLFTTSCRCHLVWWGEETDFRSPSFMEQFSPAGNKLAGHQKAEKSQRTQVSEPTTCPQLQGRTKRLLVGLFEPVENPVSLGCLQAEGWFCLWQGIFSTQHR